LGKGSDTPFQQITADQFQRSRPETMSAYDCYLRAYRRAFDARLYPATHACLEATSPPAAVSTTGVLAATPHSDDHYVFARALRPFDRHTAWAEFDLANLVMVHMFSHIMIERLRPSAVMEPGRGFAVQYAIVNGERREAVSGARGICPTCGADMLAKCGPRIIHHWAHVGRRNCDPWWESETHWHREWKNLFPENCREINHVAPDGEIHRADIKTPTGIYIEIQHSSMTDAKR
jgi:hypothetical protein